jgi:MOSC domain-containing protein YiiM
MHSFVQHATEAELEQGLPTVLASPRDAGQLEAIFVRPAPNERRALSSANLTVAGGIEGDRWAKDSRSRLEDGRSDPCCQVSLMNVRFLRQIAGSEDTLCLAGDNLIVDLDLSEANLPAGSRLAIGDSVILEISSKPHTGCSKLESRYGRDARTFMNNKRGKALHLRGRYGFVVTGGQIALGDAVRKLS